MSPGRRNLIDDLGSGAFLPTEQFGLVHEPTPRERLADGADLVTFSGDKLVGGPQAGFVVGRATLVARIRKDPLARAMRPDKVTLAAVAATLALYRAGLALERIPVWRMIAAPVDELRARASAMVAELARSDVATVDAAATVGGGSLPGETLPSVALAIDDANPDRLLQRLRTGSPIVVGRIEQGRVLLDLRTVAPPDDAALVGALRRCARSMTVVVGTAGHIDHGKTTLLRALTGIDADRLPEERARGMTIDVGYAHLTFDDGTELDFVDVPGHDRLVANMLVGAGEIDAALLVVAADDGPRAQTVEHLELLDALGIRPGIVAVTKTDAVDGNRIAVVMRQVTELIAGTTLGDAPVVAVSARSGDGLDELRVELLKLRDRVPTVPAADASPGHRRIALDRVFQVRGRGIVVTGTLRGPEIRAGEVLRVVPGDRGMTVRVREVQVHGRRVDTAGGGRVALNVAGEAAQHLERGVVLTDDREVVATDRLLVALDVAVADRTRVLVHLGTDRVLAVVGRTGRDAVDLPDGTAVAILRLERPVAAAPGDRFVLRRPSPAATVTGGRVLDPDPPRGVARRRTTVGRLAALAAPSSAATRSEGRATTAAWRAARLDLHGATADPPALADDVAASVDAALRASVQDRSDADLDDIRRGELLSSGARELRRHVGRVGPPGGSRAAIDAVTRELVAARLDRLIASGELEQSDDRVHRLGRARREPTAAEAAAMDRLVTLLSSVAPPPLSVAAAEAGCPPEAVRRLERANRIVRLDDDLAWAFPTYRELAARALALASEAPLTPAAYRDATGTSRKYVMAILEDLDRRAILRRTPDGHVPGPRAPRESGAEAVASAASPPTP